MFSYCASSDWPNVNSTILKALDLIEEYMTCFVKFNQVKCLQPIGEVVVYIGECICFSFKRCAISFATIQMGADGGHGAQDCKSNYK